MGNILKKILHKDIKYVIFNNDDECPICINNMDEINTVILECGHKFHASCMFTSIKTNFHKCPLCRKKIRFHKIKK